MNSVLHNDDLCSLIWGSATSLAVELASTSPRRIGGTRRRLGRDTRCENHQFGVQMMDLD